MDQNEIDTIGAQLAANAKPAQMTHDEVEKLAATLEDTLDYDNWHRRKGACQIKRDVRLAALLRRLWDERDKALRNGTDKATAWDAVAKARVEARNKALDEAAERAGRLLGYYDGKAVTAAILALKTQEPKP